MRTKKSDNLLGFFNSSKEKNTTIFFIVNFPLYIALSAIMAYVDVVK